MLRLVVWPAVLAMVVHSQFLCQQCGGDKYSGNVRLSRDKCCNATPVECADGLVCLRALVHSPYGNFFLSGCHPPDDEFIGCDFHSLPHNSTVQRCACRDAECQNDFPGDCPIRGIVTTTRPMPPLSRTRVGVGRASLPPLIAAARNKSATTSAKTSRTSTSSPIGDFSLASFFLLALFSRIFN